MTSVRVLLVSAYELGHQPLGVLAPAGVLRARGHDVRVLDLAREPWDPDAARDVDKVAFSVPMHTATRLVRTVAGDVDRPVACYGLYAAMCADVADAIVSRDPVTALVRWVEDDSDAQVESALPARDLVPPPSQYVRLAVAGEERIVASVAASEGCAHRCRHCPVPVVYDGRIRITSVADVIADIDQQVALGARHVSFSDPDFLNGAQHARRVVAAMHERWPELTFDATVKVEHILRHAELWADFAEAGCLFVVSAFESLDDRILERLDKGHTARDAARAVALLREHGIEIRPSWLPFTPWSDDATVRDILEFVAEHDLVGNVEPVQYTIRLLLPRGSLLLDDPEVQARIGPWDAAMCAYPWTHRDAGMDRYQEDLAELVERSVAAGDSTGITYDLVRSRAGLPPLGIEPPDRPRLTEAWFCCAEPTTSQLRAVSR